MYTSTDSPIYVHKYFFIYGAIKLYLKTSLSLATTKILRAVNKRDQVRDGRGVNFNGKICFNNGLRGIYLDIRNICMLQSRGARARDQNTKFHAINSKRNTKEDAEACFIL
jgi:hypothetical protein